jgi:outer membrane protein TolC
MPRDLQNATTRIFTSQGSISRFALRIATVAGAVVLLLTPGHAADEATLREAKANLKLEDYLKMVVEKNESIQAQLLATEASRRRLIAEWGAFEPELVGSGQHQANKRRNTIEQQRNLGGIPILDERNDLFDAGIESLTPIGTKLRVGYTLNHFNNNLTPLNATSGDERTDEWQSFGGVTVTQPLLKNGGWRFGLAAMRLAAINSESSFQEYRRQLMVTLAQAESAYWAVYFAQQQLRFLHESVEVAESILKDSRAKLEAGKGTELDVLEAEAALALRHTKRNEALQRYSESMGQLRVLAGTSPFDNHILYVANDEPETSSPAPSYEESWKTSLELNPDYILQRKKFDEALLRLSIAKNQRLPELNLKGSFGVNGLGDEARDSWQETRGGSFPSWSAGIEFRVPMLMGIRGRNEVAAAEALVMQVQMQMQGVETQLANALNTSLKKLKNSRATANDYRTMIRFSENLLKAERERLSVGKVEAHRVLEVEAGLFEVKQGLAEAKVLSERATIELFLAEGSVLKRRGIEFTPEDLRKRTAALLRDWKKKSAKPAAKPDTGVGYAPSKLNVRKLEKRRK